LFGLALGLQSPWHVNDLLFSNKKKQLDIYIDFEVGGEFKCPDCGQGELKAYDSIQKSWRHLDFFQHKAHLHARAPRVQCTKGCGTKRVEVPWARQGRGFTLLFESLMLAMCKKMPVKSVGSLVGEHDTRLWRMLHHYIDTARDKLDFSNVQRVGMDETACKRGHDYISIFCDMDEKKLLFGNVHEISSGFQ
jgi:transposase